jgi:hypothetical protein
MTEETQPRMWRQEGQTVIDGGIKAEVAVYRAAVGLLARYPSSSLSLLVISVLTALCEGLGLGVLIALLENSQATVDSLGNTPLWGTFDQWLGDMTSLSRD